MHERYVRTAPARPTPWRRVTLAVTVFWACLLCAAGLRAQCSLSCPPSLNVSLAGPLEACTTQLTATQLGAVAPGCGSLLDVDVYSASGALLPGDTLADGTRIGLVRAAQIGQTLRAQITLRATGATCAVWVSVFDAQPPQLTVRDTVISVLADASAASGFATPEVLDCSAVALTSADSVVRAGCGGQAFAKTYRRWLAVDAHQNSSTATQVIEHVAVDVADVEAPPDTLLDCTRGSIAGVALGLPVLGFGESRIALPSLDGVRDNLYWNHSDEAFAGAGGQVLVLRTWRLFDDCAAVVSGLNPRSITQRISLADTTAPVIELAFDSLSYLVSGATCEAQVVLPGAPVSDDCSGSATVSIRVAGRALVANGGYFGSLAEGSYLAEYRAEDEAGNAATAQVPVFVRDRNPPVLVLRPSVTVSLSNDGRAQLTAEQFDDGSYETCGDFELALRRIGDSTWRASVELTCADAGTQVALEVRGRDDLGNANTQRVEVHVRDLLPPTLIAPGDVVASCAADLADLSVYGEPYAYDACGLTVAPSTVVERDSCGVGEVRRSWTASDASGNSAVARQTITLRYEASFGESDVEWPRDTTLAWCGAAPTPTELLAAHGRPRYTTRRCARVSIGHRDEVFPGSAGECRRVLRTWTVRDACLADGTGAGEWRHPQWLIQLDTTPPTFVDTARALTLRSTDCTGGTAEVERWRATDCGVPTAVTLGVDFGADGLIDTVVASGSGELRFPFGQHRVTALAEDGCGNTRTRATEITVVDARVPVATCRDSLDIPLDSDGYAQVRALDLDDGSHHDCSAISLSAPPLTLDCSDREAYVPVVLQVADTLGQVAQCTTLVRAVDTSGACTPPGTYVRGRLTDRLGDDVEVVFTAVGPLGDTVEQFSSTPSGVYGFALAYADSAQVRVASTSDPLTGVSGFDLYLIAQHILGRQPFGTLAERLAADVNGSRSVSSFDLTKLRRVILSLEEGFPGGSAHAFVADTVDLAADLRLRAVTPYVLTPLQRDTQRFAATAVKLGDLTRARRVSGREALQPRTVNAVELLRRDSAGTSTYSLAEDAATVGWTLTLPEGEVRLSPKLRDGDLLCAAGHGEQRCNLLLDDPVWLRAGEPVVTVEGGRTLARKRTTAHTSDDWTGQRARGSRQGLASYPVRYREVATDLPEAARGPRVYPNPVRAGGILGVERAQRTPLLLVLTDARGSEVWRSRGGVRDVRVPTDLVPGVYHLRVAYVDGTNFTQHVLVK